MTRLRIVLSLQFDALVPIEAPQLVGAAVTRALRELAEQGAIGAEPFVVGLLNVQPMRPRRAPARRDEP